MRPVNTILCFALFAVGLFLVSCGKKDAESAEAIDISANPHSDEIVLTRAQLEASGMKIGVMEQQAFSRAVKANGYIDVPPERKASVSVKLGGFVRSLSILPGDRVAKGAVLFTLDNPEFIQLQQEYLETTAQLSYLESDYERQKALADENIASQKNFLKAESDYKMAQAKYHGLQERLKLLNVNISRLESGTIEPVASVYSPISGFISRVNITRGVFVASAFTAVEIVDTDHMHVELQVFEKDIADIRKEQNIQFRAMGSSTVHEGNVYLVGKTIENDTRTVNIHGHIHDEEEIEDLLPGMYVEATIQVASVDRPVLPAEAVVALDDKHYVLVLTDETKDSLTFKRAEVTTGLFNNQWMEIVNATDFREGEKFLTRGAFNLIVE
jgi:cobalt-zinc-cadmium efflux system membrane fusion protein